MSCIIGFPRIGEHRELKKALESFWAGKISEHELEQTAKQLRITHWQEQSALEYVCVNDFSFYDNMLDLAYILGAKPKRFSHLRGLEGYFAMARGHKDGVACEMTKWFNTNYHFVVPELSIDDAYKIDASAIISQYNDAKTLGFRPKISLIGLFTFLALSRLDGDFEKIFHAVKAAYFTLLDEIARLDASVLVEFSEPIFVRGVDSRFFHLIKPTYDAIANKGIRAVVTSFFEHSNEASRILLESEIYGLGLDFVHGEKNTEILIDFAKSNKVLFAGIIDGRNIWIANLANKLDLLKHIATHIPQERIKLSSSCSLLHAPYSKAQEINMDSEILSWLAFGKEKIRELVLLDTLFRTPDDDNAKRLLAENQAIITTRKHSNKIHNSAIQQRLNSPIKTARDEAFATRIIKQRKALKYPNLATTTIGSFPQTQELRALRLGYKKKAISSEQYKEGIQAYIRECIAFQEEVGLDVLVHGEPERNDMVEYFGEQMRGFVFSQNAWVQSYGSRCVKPPIIYGDVAREQPMTIEWITYAQSLTTKIVKGMLTGPVTILNWSFVRDDIPRALVCKQIALGIADEISDLQDAGIKIIQVDEAAFKEGYPLRQEHVAEYERWALESFKIATAQAHSHTQIHTHMCYSEFNDIIKSIEALDADVISIETTRSGNALLHVFKNVGYTHEIGPGVYDIHSPRIPSVKELEGQILALLDVLPKEQLWINPDCGLKTRKWEEVRPSLKNLVQATKNILHTLS